MSDISKTATTPLRLAFIGGATTSAVGYTHFTASRLDGTYHLVAGCFSRKDALNRQSAITYGVPADRTYRNWKQLLCEERDRVDAIAVLTPTPIHAEIVIAALEMGYAVICEKALCLTSEECRSIQAAVDRSEGYLAVTFNYSGYPMVRELRHMIREGRLGDIQQVHIEMPQEAYLRRGVNPQDWRRQDHVIPTVSLDLGVHVHHLMDFVTSGTRPIELTGDQSSYGKFPDLIDNVYCLARYQNEMRMQAWWGKTALGYRNGLRIRVFGSQAGAEWVQTDPETLRISDSDGRILILDRSAGDCAVASEPRYNRFKSGHPSGFIEAFANLYSDLAEDIQRHKEGLKASTPFVFGSRHALDGMIFLEATHQAGLKKTWVSVRNR
ncbi:Gfo/Idh/MocA family protein [Arhodomonas aquaeolei]|uniref:Gfo/Idh/MocA family protein n=1 Tax=Arhodomonas aquaeolei TaxID=2369 RepID=UPI000A03B60D|nr:Gfo/Idh/MocA family oxidoreductase [Arhodomonas aquaeolei]